MTDEPTTAAGPRLTDGTQLPRPMAWYRTVEDGRLLFGCLISPAEAAALRREGAAEAAAEVIAGRIAAHVNDGAGERDAMAWSEGHTAGYEEGRREGAAEVLAAVEAVEDPGIYPAASPDGPRTEWQDGWNKGVMAVIEAYEDAIEAERKKTAETA